MGELRGWGRINPTKPDITCPIRPAYLKNNDSIKTPDVNEASQLAYVLDLYIMTLEICFAEFVQETLP